MGILVGRKDAEDIVVLMDGFAKVAALLLVPPITVGVPELTLFGGWIDVTAVHAGVLDVGLRDASDLRSSRECSGFAEEMWDRTDCDECLG